MPDKDISHMIPKYGKPNANPKDWILTEAEQEEIRLLKIRFGVT